MEAFFWSFTTAGTNLTYFLPLLTAQRLQGEFFKDKNLVFIGYRILTAVKIIFIKRKKGSTGLPSIVE